MDTEKALALFRYQAVYNQVYQEYLRHLGRNPETVTSVYEIPFLPIRFFKTHRVVSGEVKEEAVFLSSGTTQQNRSQHVVPSILAYQIGAQKNFEALYGPLNEWIVMALLPSYLEQGQSSLVCMVDYFIQQTNHPLSSFYLYDWKQLADNLGAAKRSGRKVLLLGVSYALLDLAEADIIKGWPGLVIMETGGMKGRRKELIRRELHEQLSSAFQVHAIHSEYGMTELFSQAYAKEAGRFLNTSTLSAFVRDINDPFAIKANGRGALNLIDLANTHSCAFIETEDLGIAHDDGTFEVLGRLDNAEIRGCSLLYS